ncbi:hypothetical protein MHF_1436 [Mycoplasma haemofelis Ohio2]|uniref:Uncharacterized protein n=1 Tax=Mycoplasma haemofelis (strain Ohio2) TaxID=859194 RepID=F6FGN2_MYCHI|nr:hypothetical protein MHF_1436 [Mycoplasma haemofelis Ohio2]
MNFLSKAALSTGALGAAGTGSYFLIKKDRFSNKERVVLDLTGNSHDSIWTALINEYKTSHENERIKGVTTATPELQKIKEYCNSTGDSVDNGFLDIYTKWCTRATLKHHFDTSGTKRWIEDDSGWSASLSSYQKEDNLDEKLKLSKDTNTKFSKTDITKEAIVGFCNTASQSLFVDISNDDYKKSDKWCTK